MNGADLTPRFSSPGLTLRSESTAPPDDLRQPPRLLLAHAGVDPVEQPAHVGQRVAGIAVLLRGEAGEVGVVGGAEEVGLDAARVAVLDPVDVDRDEDVGARPGWRARPAARAPPARPGSGSSPPGSPRPPGASATARHDGDSFFSISPRGMCGCRSSRPPCPRSIATLRTASGKTPASTGSAVPVKRAAAAPPALDAVLPASGGGRSTGPAACGGAAGRGMNEEIRRVEPRRPTGRSTSASTRAVSLRPVRRRRLCAGSPSISSTFSRTSSRSIWRLRLFTFDIRSPSLRLDRPSRDLGKGQGSAFYYSPLPPGAV